MFHNHIFLELLSIGKIAQCMLIITAWELITIPPLSIVHIHNSKGAYLRCITHGFFFLLDICIFFLIHVNLYPLRDNKMSLYNLSKI